MSLGFADRPTLHTRFLCTNEGGLAEWWAGGAQPRGRVSDAPTLGANSILPKSITISSKIYQGHLQRGSTAMGEFRVQDRHQRQGDLKRIDLLQVVLSLTRPIRPNLARSTPFFL